MEDEGRTRRPENCYHGKRNCLTGKINARDYWLTFDVPPIVPEEIWNEPSIAKDELVWNWAKDLLTKPGILEDILAEYQDEREQFYAPIRDRLIVLNDLWQDSKSQLDRVLDLYISDNIQRKSLIDKKQRLESILTALENKRDDLNMNLETKFCRKMKSNRLENLLLRLLKG